MSRENEHYSRGIKTGLGLAVLAGWLLYMATKHPEALKATAESIKKPAPAPAPSPSEKEVLARAKEAQSLAFMAECRMDEAAHRAQLSYNRLATVAVAMAIGAPLLLGLIVVLTSII